MNKRDWEERERGNCRAESDVLAENETANRVSNSVEEREIETHTV